MSKLSLELFHWKHRVRAFLGRNFYKLKHFTDRVYLESQIEKSGGMENLLDGFSLDRGSAFVPVEMVQRECEISRIGALAFEVIESGVIAGKKPDENYEIAIYGACRDALGGNLFNKDLVNPHMLAYS